MGMWAFQGQFVEIVQNDANKLFAEVSPKINPHLFLIGIPIDDRSVVIESELLGIDSSAFASVAQAAYESYIGDAKSAVRQDDPLSNKRYHERLRLKHLRTAVSDVI